MDTDAEPVKKACAKMMKNAQRQQRYRLKRKYFDPYPLHLVTKKSPLKSMTDDQWNELVEGWKDQRKMVTCSCTTISLMLDCYLIFSVVQHFLGC